MILAFRLFESQNLFFLMAFLPTTKKEIENLGWDSVDVIFVSGDAYIDHPSFGAAVISRHLEACGFRVAILAQPNWKDDLRDFKKLGKPRICFAVSSGSMDSMVNHYTAAKRKRNDDAYTPGGQSGFRPDRATVVYSKILKSIYPDTPVLIGGIEASMRRLAHYDYWEDRLFPSILLESKADLLIYGMGEKICEKICRRLSEGESIEDLNDIAQIAYVEKGDVKPSDVADCYLHSFEDCLKDKRKQSENIATFEKNSNKYNAERLIQVYEKEKLKVVVNPFDQTYSSADLDNIYQLPFERKPHPKYVKRGPIPAFDMIKYSVNIHRGCFGGCAFCTIAAHQGKRIISRSEASIMQEIKQISQDKDFKGYLSDLGGPSANMYLMKGKDESLCKKCTRASCLYPSLCKNMNNDHRPLLDLYKKVRELPYIKKVFIGSGVRYDLFDKSEYFETLVRYHVSGRLKVAPEHSSENVLKAMRKMSFDQFVDIKKRFEMINSKYGLNQQLIPYFISSHPVCTLKDMALLALKTAELGYKLEQVQDFTPTPMTISTEMYYTGYDPMSLKRVFVERNPDAKKCQNRVFFWYKPENKIWANNIFKKYNLPIPKIKTDRIKR